MTTKQDYSKTMRNEMHHIMDHAQTLVDTTSGEAVFIGLRRRLARRPLAFDQSLAELKKDTACFSTSI
jgi:hypothetical protein